MGEKALPKYVADLLDRIAKENGFSDFVIQIKSGSEVGDGFTSEITCATIAEKNSESQLHLVCKLAPLNENRRKEFWADILFGREITFYNKVMPSFVKFQDEKKLPKEDQFSAYPKCYAAINDTENEQYVIVLEDLRPRGFKLWNKAKVAPLENVRLGMREIGKLHGISMAMKEQRPNEFSEFQKLTDICRDFFQKDSIRGMLDASFDRAIETLRSENHKNIMRNMKTNSPIYLKTILSEKNRFAVIAHGDFWNNNILFRFDENNVAADIRLLDWQMLRYVSPVADIVYNLFSCTDRALRDKEYDNLLQLYHNSLSNTVRLLGSDPDELFTFDDLQEELKKYGSFALLMAPMLIQTAVADSSEISNLDEICDKMAEGHRQELITGLNETAQLEYHRRLNEVFEDVIDKLGYYHEFN